MGKRGKGATLAALALAAEAGSPLPADGDGRIEVVRGDQLAEKRG